MITIIYFTYDDKACAILVSSFAYFFIFSTGNESPHTPRSHIRISLGYFAIILALH